MPRTNTAERDENKNCARAQSITLGVFIRGPFSAVIEKRTKIIIMKKKIPVTMKRGTIYAAQYPNVETEWNGAQ